MVEQAKHLKGIPINLGQLDSNQYLFNVDNGTIDLRTGELLSHRKEDLITVMVPVIYDKTAICPKWLKFLDRATSGNKELQSYLQRGVGLSLTGDVRSEVIFLLYGLGNNGKSTFTMTIRKLMAGYGHRLDAEDLMVKEKQRGGPKEGIADLNNKRYVVCSEIQDGRTLDCSLVKDLTGGETIKARRMYEHEVEYMPTAKLWLYGNHKPVIKDSTLSIWRRVKLIPFGVTIPAKEVNENLKDELAEELPGILNWAIEGCLAWQHDNLGTCKLVSDATADYRHDSDILGDFLEDKCVISQELMIVKKDMKELYAAWCSENGVEAVSQVTFKKRLLEKGIIDWKGTAGKRYWKGVGNRIENTESGEVA
jgi:putative DNA primase/helicase